MKITLPALAGAVVFGACAAANAGVINYSWDASATTAQVGDTVQLTLKAEVDPQGGVYQGLAGTIFDIAIGDGPGQGAADISSPGLGLAPAFVGLGAQGTLIGNNAVVGIQAGGLPGSVTATSFDLYSLNYTITDPSPRTIIFDVSVSESQVYNGENFGFGVESYEASSTPLAVTVTPVPAPGALALLGLAGCVAARRRRH